MLETHRDRIQSGKKLHSSRLPGFYDLSSSERLEIVKSMKGLSSEEAAALGNHGAAGARLNDIFIENAIGACGLPLGIATNFHIGGKDLLVPMAVEESSVVAAASHGAKLARSGGGFQTWSTPCVMTGQVELIFEGALPQDLDATIQNNLKALELISKEGLERLEARGGGLAEIEWRVIPEIRSLVFLLHIDTCDAMGANIVNSACERLSAKLAGVFPDWNFEIGLRILTNLNERRRAGARCRILHQLFDSKALCGQDVVRKIHRAWLFADHDTHRAATNNKGIMNGIDPVLIATGNDWRAVESGAHAWAARTGRYRPLASWTVDESTGDLIGEMELPIAVGTVGGVTKLHPTAKAVLKVLGSPGAAELAEICCAVGLAQNLSALRALSSEGIQRGHMSLHEKNIQAAKRAGATAHPAD